MRLVSYATKGSDDFAPGIETAGGIVPAAWAAREAGFADAEVSALRTNRDVLALGADGLVKLATASASANGAALASTGLTLGPPVADPQKIVCLGLNYRDHAEEAGLAPPDAPMFFAKFANSLAGPADDIVPPTTTEKVDYEAEMAVVIGRAGRNIAEEDALEHVAGVMALNDVSARDLQMANTLWTGGKAIDTFAPCGPSLVTLDELGDIQNMGLRTRVNGEVVQEGSTASMIFGVAETIAFLSTIMTLEPGDIIATGTPAGVGVSRTPPRFLQAGDEVEVELDGVGTLHNTVVGS